MQDFGQLIENIALRLPDLPEETPKNLFDILGIRNKETINSRILAYFLDVNESHGFNDLFFTSLKTLIEEKHKVDTIFLDIFNGGYNVITEDTTSYADEETKKRIDISLLGEDSWGIIIENKLYHNLINPLKAYWEHTEKYCGETIIGIVLTLHPTPKEQITVKLKDKKVTYYNITHKEWIAEVQKQLNLGEVQSIEGLFYLKEYIKTIDSHYQTQMSEPHFNSLAKAIIQQREHVQEIQDKVAQTAKFLELQISEVFATYDYEKVGSWYTYKEASYPLYFYVPKADDVLKNNKLWFTLEVRNELNKTLRSSDNVPLMHKHFATLISKHKNTRTSNESRTTYTHIAITSIPDVISENSDLKTAFAKALKDIYFNNNGLVKEAEKYLAKLSATQMK